MIKKIQSIQKEVYQILVKYPDTRDNDRLLMLKIWSNQNNHLRTRTFTFYSFALEFINGNFADPETIRRARQRIQEKYPHLRGVGYERRLKLQQETQAQIKFI